MASALPLVELVEVHTNDGVVHAGALAKPAKRPGGTPRFDAVLMMHGAAGAFSEGFYRNFSAALVERGVTTLRANNRGHDVVNRGDGRGKLQGAALEQLDDCVLDWQAWLGFLQSRRFHRILLFGHSLGAVKTAYYLATQPDARVQGCVLASPPRFNTELMLASERGHEFAATLERAKALVAAGRPDELMPTTFPLRSFSGAEAYLAKYAMGAKYDVLENVAAGFRARCWRSPGRWNWATRSSATTRPAIPRCGKRNGTSTSSWSRTAITTIPSRRRSPSNICSHGSTGKASTKRPGRLRVRRRARPWNRGRTTSCRRPSSCR